MWRWSQPYADISHWNLYFLWCLQWDFQFHVVFLTDFNSESHLPFFKSLFLLYSGFSILSRVPLSTLQSDGWMASSTPICFTKVNTGSSCSLWLVVVVGRGFFPSSQYLFPLLSDWFFSHSLVTTFSVFPPSLCTPCCQRHLSHVVPFYVLCNTHRVTVILFHSLLCLS